MIFAYFSMYILSESPNIGGLGLQKKSHMTNMSKNMCSRLRSQTSIGTYSNAESNVRRDSDLLDPGLMTQLTVKIIHHHIWG